MKTQMRFQKILVLISLILAALCIVYSLIFCSGVINQISAIKDDYYDAYDLYDAAQAFSDTFLILGIILILAIVLLYITATQKRRNYYISNYVAIGIVLVYEIVYAVLLLINVVNVQTIFGSLDLDLCKDYYVNAAAESRGTWNGTPWTFYVGYALVALILIDAVLIALNLVWKIKLMRGEKALLEQGLVKEVA